MFKFKAEPKPLPHQYEIFDKYKDRDIFALHADMGIGKTKSLIDICAYKNYNGVLDRVFIIAPNGVHAQWINEQFPEHCPVPYKAHICSSEKTLKYLKKEDYFLWQCHESRDYRIMAINVEAFTIERGLDVARRFLKTSKQGTAILVDEASIIKTPDIVTTRNIKKLRVEFPKAFRSTLTGTPAAKGPIDMWSIYDFLRKEYMGCSYIAFKMMHRIVYKKRIKVRGKLITIYSDIKEDMFDRIKSVIELKRTNGKIGDYDIEAIKTKFSLSTNNFWQIANSNVFCKYKNLDKLHEKIKPDTYMISKAECLKLPPKIKEVKFFELNKHQKELIAQLNKYAVATYQGKELTLQIKALLGLRILEICGGFFSHHTDIEGEFASLPIKGKNAKLEFLKHDISELGDQQSLIWAVHTNEIELIYNTLRQNHLIGRLDGAITGDDRIEVVENFKSGKLQHLVVQPKVGSFGYNFQMASASYWYSRNYRTQERIQGEDRIYRLGIEKSPIYKDLLYDIYWEREVYETVKDEAALNELFITSDISKLFNLKRSKK